MRAKLELAVAVSPEAVTAGYRGLLEWEGVEA